jgi:hypothetical protein
MKSARTILAFASLVCSAAPSLRAQELGQPWGTAEAESRYYRVVEIGLPGFPELEAGSMCTLPDGRLAVGTRRGEILIVEGAFDALPDPKITVFASGLDEVLGLGFRDGALYAMQQTELTRITDRDGDGRGDRFDNLSDVWGFEHYHEFAWGSPVQPDGSVTVVLGLSESYHYKARFRGWAFQVTADGRSIPIASGIRSAGGVAPNEQGVMFYVVSQGPWNGSCSLKHLKPGGFMGHPISFAGYDEPLGATLGPKPTEPETPSRLVTEAERVPELVPYAVVFPYRKMGQSITTFRPDRSGGRFGPFEGQLFLGDYSLSLVMRATTELVDGVWQGACYPFREGLGNGILCVEFGPDGKLMAGGTNRGWPVRGNKRHILERIEWTGRTPFEVERITVRKHGFRLRFTLPVDPAACAETSRYQLSTYTHIYRQGYGSPEVDQTTPTVTEARVSADGLEVELDVDGMVVGHVHEFDLAALRSAADEPPLHRHAYYTLNRLPR